jgi:hypothetical protein
MTTGDQELAAELFHLINCLVDQRVQVMIQPMQDELELAKKLVKSMMSEWVDTKETKRLTNIKRSDTLKALRDKPNPILKGKQIGTQWYYLRESIAALNDSMTYKRVVGRNLAA